MAETIIPRWEWRMFARQIEPRIDLAAQPKTRHAVSSEIYLVCETSDDNPKIRDDKMDIKHLQRVDADGLEQWKPVMKADFPLSAEQLREVYQTLDLGAPRPEGGADRYAVVPGADRRGPPGARRPRR